MFAIFSLKTKINRSLFLQNLYITGKHLKLMYFQFAILIFKMFAFSIALYRIHVIKVKIFQKGPAYPVFKTWKTDLRALTYFFAVMGTRCINVFPRIASDFDSATDNSSTEVNDGTDLHLHSETDFLHV